VPEKTSRSSAWQAAQKHHCAAGKVVHYSPGRVDETGTVAAETLS